MTHPLPWVQVDEPLPDASLALSEPPGLVAAGLDLSTARLNEAYRKGIFPWFSDGQPVLWWSPDPRMVLYTDELHLSHSLKKRLRQIERSPASQSLKASSCSTGMVVTTDMAFDAVLEGCAQRGTDRPQDTWITSPMADVYRQWHRQGAVHSVEVWSGQQLVGGLYGVCLGHMFFGESMFSRVSDASKIALSYLVRFLSAQGVRLIDCQMQTGHLARLGAREIPRTTFLEHLSKAVTLAPLRWPAGRLTLSGKIEHNHDFNVAHTHADPTIGYS
jgi:leucyl/phenylalanyl-tRNA--protein transferase